jgi:hypothetical protein
MTVIAILTNKEADVALAMLVGHSIQVGSWIEISDVTVTDTGRHLQGNSPRMLVGQEFRIACLEDGPIFARREADSFQGPNKPARFVAVDVVNTDQVSMFAWRSVMPRPETGARP